MESDVRKPSGNVKMPEILSQWVKYMLKEEFNGVVEREIEQTGKLTQQTWKITAYNISKKIKESRQMTNFLTNIHSLVDRDCLRTAPTVGDNSNLQLADPRQIEHSFHQAFSVNRSALMKLDALNMLLHSQLLHVMVNSNHEISSKSWEKISPHLRKCLHDDDMKIFSASLKIHVKFVSSMLPQVAKEGFANLVDAIGYFYSQNHSNIPSYDMTFDEPNLLKMIKIVHLILFTVNKTSHHFLKASDKLPEDIMEKFFELLTFTTAKSELDPFSIVSAVDPHARWFQNALRGNVMQEQIFHLLLKSTFTRELVSIIFNFDEARKNKFYYAKFVHSAEMFRTIMKYHQGRRLFPIPTNAQDKPITIEHVYLHVIKYLGDGNKTGAAVLSNVLVDGITVCLDTSVLKANSLMMMEILEPLPFALPSHSLRALEAIVATEIGLRCLINAQGTSALLDYTALVLNNEIDCNPKEKITLLRVCGKVLGDHRGYSSNMESRVIFEVMCSFQREIYAQVHEKNNVREALLQCITSIGSTPLGTLALSQVPGLLEELTLIWSSSGKKEHLRCLSLASFLDVDQQWSDMPPLVAPRSKDRSNHKASELSKFLNSSKEAPHDNEWYAQLRATFRTMGQEPIKPEVILELVEHLACDKSSLPSRHPATKPSHEVDSQVLAAAEWTLRYGECNNLLQSSLQDVDGLLELFGSYGSYEDWFLATSFLLCGGNVDKCRSFLSAISSLTAGAILWPDKQSENYHEESFQSGHYLEAIVEEEFPIASKALRMSGISWWYVTRMWILHSFLPSQQWNEICQWVIYCLIFPKDRGLYYCLALLKHMEPLILKCADNGTIVQLIRKPIDGFRLTEYWSYIDKLLERYGNELNLGWMSVENQ